MRFGRIAHTAADRGPGYPRRHGQRGLLPLDGSSGVRRPRADRRGALDPAPRVAVVDGLHDALWVSRLGLLAGAAVAALLL